MSRNFLELRLGQSLTLTPALQQSIKLLQLSALDLEAEIARALAENPLLEQEGEGLQTPAAAAIAQPGDGPVYEGDAKEQAQALDPLCSNLQSLTDPRVPLSDFFTGKALGYFLYHFAFSLGQTKFSASLPKKFTGIKR